jgi:hypothetical protein
MSPGMLVDARIIAKVLIEDRGRVMVRYRLLFQNDPLLNVYLSFPDDLFRVFVIAKRNEFGVSQMVGTGPLQKSYLSYGLGLQPLCRMPDYAACIWDSNSPLAILWVWS